MPRRTLVKVCGIRTVADARAAVDAGADALGVNFAPGSPRRVDPAFLAELLPALPAGFPVAAVVVDPPDFSLFSACPIVQLHGDEAPARARAAAAAQRVWKAFRWRGETTAAAIAAYWRSCAPAPPEALLLDAFAGAAHGGTGTPWRWQDAARPWPAPLILAGGLRPENVGAAVAAARPWMVDVASGVEDAPGVKSPAAMRAFVAAVRAADAPA